MRPSTSRAPSTSMSVMRAWACGERTNAAARAPEPMSSRYRPLPMISRASSRRRTGSPNSLVVTRTPEGPLWPSRPSSGAALHRLGRVVHGLLDVGVARAPAEVAADHVVDLLLGQLGGVVTRLEPGGD